MQRLALLVLLLTACGRTGLPDDNAANRWWNTAYAQRLRIAVDNSAGLEDVSSFPLAVRIAPATLPLAAPHQVRFVARDGATVLAHEMETTDDGVLYWVRLPLLQPGTSSFWLYFDNPNASAADDGAGVFGDYLAVWHFGETAGTDVVDSTGHGKTGVMSPTGVERVASTFGRGLHFAGGHVRVASDATETLAQAAEGMTIEALIARESADDGGYGVIVGRQLGVDTVDSYVLTLTIDANDTLHFCTVSCASSKRGTVPRQVPAMVAAVRENRLSTIYVDGAVASSAAVTSNPSYDDNDVIIGGQENRADDTVDELFSGIIDELRIAATPRTPAYLAAAAQNMSGTWLTFTAIETR